MFGYKWKTLKMSMRDIDKALRVCDNVSTVDSCGPGTLADSILLHPEMLPQAQAEGCQEGNERCRRPEISPTARKCLQRKGYRLI